MKPLARSIYPYLFLFFCFVIPLDKYATAVPNIILIAMLVLFPLVATKDSLIKLLRREFLLLGLVVLLVGLNSLLFHDIGRDWVVIKKMLGALLLIVLYTPLEKTENLMKTVIISVLVCIGISLLNLYNYYLEIGYFEFAFGPAINDVLIIDRLYLGYLCTLSIVSSIALIGSRYNEYNRWYLVNIVLNVLFVLLISSRIAIILLLLVLLLKLFYTTKRKVLLGFFGATLGLIVLAFTLNENLQHRFLYSHDKEQKSYVELFMEWEPRVVIWQCNYEIAADQSAGAHLIGSGFYGLKDELVDCYSDRIDKERRKEYFIKSRFNPHNQYFDFYLSSGIVVALLFLVVMFLLMKNHRRSYYKMALLMCLLFFGMIEAYFQRQMGAYYFGIVVILIYQASSAFLEKQNQPVPSKSEGQ